MELTIKLSLFKTELRSLELECRAMWIPCQLITDVTGYYALVHLTSLQKLKVTEIGVPEKFDVNGPNKNSFLLYEFPVYKYYIM